MSVCNREYLPLCSIPLVSNRDGIGEPNANIYLPGLDHLFFFDGTIRTFPFSTVPQNKKRFLNGVSKPDTFSKGCCH